MFTTVFDHSKVRLHCPKFYESSSTIISLSIRGKTKKDVLEVGMILLLTVSTEIWKTKVKETNFHLQKI